MCTQLKYMQEHTLEIPLLPVLSALTKFKAIKVGGKKGGDRGASGTFFIFLFVQFLPLWNVLAESPGYKMKETRLQKQPTCLPVLKGAY